MSDSIDLLRLFNSAPKDEKNVFIDDPRTHAFFEGLAKSKPLNPIELLDLAERAGRDPKLAPLTAAIVLRAIGDIGHDRRVLEILSKVADEQTTWGLSIRDTLAKMTKAHRSLSPRFTMGVGVGGDGFPSSSETYSDSWAYTAAGSGCTYQPPSGAAVTLSPKQTKVFTTSPTEVFGLTEWYVIVVTCIYMPIGSQDTCLQIETITHTKY
jgi:hypothetical protein